MDNKILIGAALLGGFIIYKKSKTYVPEENEINEEISTEPLNSLEPAIINDQENYEVLQADTLPKETQDKIIEKIKEEKSFQRGKLYAVELSGAIFLLSAGVAYLIKMVIERHIGKDYGGAFEQSAKEGLLRKVNEVNVDFEGGDFKTVTNNKQQQSELAKKFNKGFRSFKKSISNKIENIKDYINPGRHNETAIKNKTNEIRENIEKLDSEEKKEFYKKKLDDLINNPRKPKASNLKTRGGRAAAYQATLRNTVLDLNDFLEDLLNTILNNRNGNLLFSSFGNKNRVFFSGSNPMQEFHRSEYGILESDPVYLSDLSESESLYEQMQLESVFYNIVIDSMNEFMVIKTIDPTNVETEKKEETVETGETEVFENTSSNFNKLTQVSNKSLDSGFRDQINDLIIYLTTLIKSLRIDRLNEEAQGIIDQLNGFVNQLIKMKNDEELEITNEFIETLTERIKKFISKRTEKIISLKSDQVPLYMMKSHISSISQTLDKNYSIIN